METRWIKTKTGLYMEVIDPDWDDLFENIEPPTREEMLAASRRYLMKHYGEAVAETEAILADPETMAAIEEAKTELRSGSAEGGLNEST